MTNTINNVSKFWNLRGIHTLQFKNVQEETIGQLPTTKTSYVISDTQVVYKAIQL